MNNKIFFVFFLIFSFIFVFIFLATKNNWSILRTGYYAYQAANDVQFYSEPSARTNSIHGTKGIGGGPGYGK
jgi:hypothetical protein